MRTPLTALAILVGSICSARAQDATLPTAFRCDFESTDARILSTEETGALNTEPVRDLIFTEIDSAAGSALQILPTGETPLTFLASGMNIVHFVEASPNGSLTFTTIFLKTRKQIDGGGFSYPVFRAVMSRHLATFGGEGHIGQAIGSCKGVR